jgi:hypothetical protein
MAVLYFTRNGKVIGKVVSPMGSNDLRIVWGLPLLGAGGYWTKNGVPMPKSGFIAPFGTNDFHFVLMPGGPQVPVVPPAGANDIEIVWRGSEIVKAWWTRNGRRLKPLSGLDAPRRLDWKARPRAR